MIEAIFSIPGISALARMSRFSRASGNAPVGTLNETREQGYWDHVFVTLDYPEIFAEKPIFWVMNRDLPAVFGADDS